MYAIYAEKGTYDDFQEYLSNAVYDNSNEIKSNLIYYAEKFLQKVEAELPTAHGSAHLHPDHGLGGSGLGGQTVRGRRTVLGGQELHHPLQRPAEHTAPSLPLEQAHLRVIPTRKDYTYLRESLLIDFISVRKSYTATRRAVSMNYYEPELSFSGERITVNGCLPPERVSPELELDPGEHDAQDVGGGGRSLKDYSTKVST